MHNPGIDANHQGDIIIGRGDEFTGIAGVGRAAKLFEADKIGVFGAQGVEKIGPGGKAVIRAVVDDRGHVGGSRKDRLEMRPLRCGRGAARQDTGNDHQPMRADLCRVPGDRHGSRSVDGAGADDHLHAGFYQTLDTFHALRVA